MAQTEEWLQNLKEKIVDEKDATNFDDIIKCYQNGLLRAGYLMAWLMLIESLKRKVIELEANGVKAAKVELAKIQQIENALQSNDEVIRKAALACDLISSEEAQVLDLLWKKRCIMSHPYMPRIRGRFLDPLYRNHKTVPKSNFTCPLGVSVCCLGDG